MPKNLLKLILLLALPITLVCAKPASPITTLPIEIESDTALWDQNTKQAVHEGNVIMKQGDRILRADKLIIEKNAKGEINQMVATGQPATITGPLPDSTTEMLDGHANTIYFFPLSEKLTLKGDAKLLQGQNTFTGPEVAFDFMSKQISAQRANKARPTLIYQPTAS